MKDVIKFLSFIAYTTSIFFLPNNPLILLLFIVNFSIIYLKKIPIKKVSRKTIQVLPFIIFTFAINCILDKITNAIWIGIKLILVCNITIIYSETTSINGMAKTIKTLFYPLKIFKVNTEDIRVMVCISLSMIPILKKDLIEVKEACIAKNIKFNIKNTKIILVRFFGTLISRVSQIEESLIEKGYNSEN